MLYRSDGITLIKDEIGTRDMTGFDTIDQHRLAKFPFDGVATLGLRSRPRLGDLARQRHQPIFSCSAGLYRLRS